MTSRAFFKALISVYLLLFAHRLQSKWQRQFPVASEATLSACALGWQQLTSMDGPRACCIIKHGCPIYSMLTLAYIPALASRLTDRVLLADP